MQYKIQCYTDQNSPRIIDAQEGAELLTVLREYQIPIEAACNGKGICGKCRVQILQGHAPVTKEEHSFLTEQEIASGYRLACKVRVQDHLVIRIQSGCMDIQALGLESAGAGAADAEKETEAAGETKAAETARAAEWVIDAESAESVYAAVDLGTTTLAAVLLDREGHVLAQASAVNSQRAYGADVISRIQASNEGKRERLQACICRDLEGLFQALLRQHGSPVRVSKIAIAGNTTMLHLLRGYSCEKLGQAPFEPVNLELECLDYSSLFAESPGYSGSIVYLLPGISAFVGADIVAGFYGSGFWQTGKDRPAFFVDLGTNGELAFGSRDGFVTTSTAAGPAFEGGRLSCGAPGIPGAIARVSYLYHRVRVQTIGQKKPCGICGTGAMEAVAALLKEGLLDADGLLAPELFETGMALARREDGSSICLTQADIREIQMAKAAIRAGIELLQKTYEAEFGKVSKVQEGCVYLAGGFGHALSADTAAAIGLFPAEWRDRIIPVGNTSLKGAMIFLKDGFRAEELEKIRIGNRSLRLESHPEFPEIYLREMRFRLI